MQELDAFDKFRDSFNRTSAHFHVLEQRVSVELQMEYFKYSQQLRKTATTMTDADFDSYVESLSDPTLDLAKKKSILSSLAISRQVKAFRFLEDYVSKADADVHVKRRCDVTNISFCSDAGIFVEKLEGCLQISIESEFAYIVTNDTQFASRIVCQDTSQTF